MGVEATLVGWTICNVTVITIVVMIVLLIGISVFWTVSPVKMNSVIAGVRFILATLVVGANSVIGVIFLSVHLRSLRFFWSFGLFFFTITFSGV